MQFVSLLPLWLLLPLALITFATWRTSLVDRPPMMKVAALACRTVSIVLFILCLCRPYSRSSADQAHIVFLVDVSESVDVSGIELAFKEIDQAVATLKSGDTWSMALFAKETNPVTREQADLWLKELKEGRTDADFRSDSRMADALSLSRLQFPADKSRRLIVFSDGVNDDGVSKQWESLRREQTDLQFKQIAPLANAEAGVVAFESPSPIAFEGEIVRLKVSATANQDMNGKLRITNRGVVVAEKAVRLEKGKTLVERVDVEMGVSGETVWEAEIAPEKDWFPENNRLSLGITVRGKPRILVLHERPQAMRAAERLLREQGVELETRGARGLPVSMNELLAFDAIMLADVPATSLERSQMDNLKTYVSHFGGGLIMMGSENTYGLGGYYKTPVEEVLPLVSRFEKEKEKPSLAMCIVLDRSGSMSGQPLALARQAARSAAELLGAQDQIAVIAFDDQPTLVLDLTPAGNKAQIAQAIDSIAEGGGTNMQPGMAQGRDILRGANAKIKHVIGLTDGQTEPADLVQMCQEMADAGMTVSTVAMGDGAARELLAQMAEAGKGRYYETNAPENVPQIFTRETMQASRSAIKEDIFASIPVGDHPVLSGFSDTELPAVLGYVMTKPKPTAQVILALESGDPLLAIGRFGTGTGLCFTADLTERWAGEWLSWSGCGKFWSQVLRGTLKRADATGIEVKPTVADDTWLIEMNRRDDAGRPLSAVPWSAAALDEKSASRPVSIIETGVGRYQARIPLDGAQQVNVRIQDTDHGKVKLMQWLRPYPQEYQLTSTLKDIFTQIPPFETDKIRQNLLNVSLHRSLIPSFVIAAIVLLITGVVFRRI